LEGDEVSGITVFEPGDFVLIELPDGETRVFRLEKNKETMTKYGVVKHNDVIGKPQGSIIKTTAGHTIAVFKPTLFDLQLNYCERITQVIYPKDSAYIVEYAGVRSGDKVFEAGVGSGFLTMLLACRVAPGGIVYGFDINPKALEVTMQNVRLTGCEQNVVLFNHDIKNGIPVVDASAGFLDVPDPWGVLDHAWKALAPGGKLVIFVPTVNQVVRVAKSLKTSGFGLIRIVEIMNREYEVNPDAIRPISVQVVHTGYIVFARKTVI
jgi:tRNA (adenine57-N1/adenine58-N1)-methyltransferase